MDSVPWIPRTDHGIVVLQTDGHAPVRVFDAWAQRRKERENQWNEDEEATLETWKQFFDLIQEHRESVTSFESKCTTLQGKLGNFREAYDRGGFYAVHVCAALGLAELLSVLLENGYSAESECVQDNNIGLWDEVTYVLTRGVRPLHLAAKYGHCNVIQVLLDHGADLHAQATTCQGELTQKVTSVQIAAREGCHPAAIALFERGADVCQDGRYGRAESCGGPAFARLLMERGHIAQEVSINLMLRRVANSLWRGVPREKVVGAVEEILELMADLHMKPRNLLPTFVHNGSICREAAMEIVLLLVLYGANVANENDALLHAAFQGNERMLKLMFMLGWNAGGAVKTLNKGTGQALQGIHADVAVLERVPAFAARSRRHLARAIDLLEDASKQVPSLQIWCRWAILSALQDPRKVAQLPIPPVMKSFILLANERHELLREGES